MNCRLIIKGLVIIHVEAFILLLQFLEYLSFEITGILTIDIL